MTKKKLHELLKKCDPKSVQAWTIRWACGSVGCNPVDRMSDLSRHGCISGLVSELIYTHDCVDFYVRFETDIWHIVAQFLDNTGETIGEFIDHLRPEVQDLDGLKTTLSWFAVEETAAQLLERLGASNS
ncbi:hypothetical protein EBR57_03755 [bacterium]|nr:hypothetical protein [bacterium]